MRAISCKFCTRIHRTCDGDRANGIGCTLCIAHTKANPNHQCIFADGTLLAPRPATVFPMAIKHKCDRCRAKRTIACSWLAEPSGPAWKQACTQCRNAGEACLWEGHLIQDCSQDPPLNGPPFQITPAQLQPPPTAPPTVPAIAPTPVFPFVGRPVQALAPAPAPVFPPPPAGFQVGTQHVASQSQPPTNVVAPPSVAGRRRQQEEDDEDDDDYGAHHPKRSRFSNPYNPAFRTGSVSAGTRSQTAQTPQSQRSTAVERLRQQLEQNQTNNHSQLGISSGISLRSGRHLTPATSFASPEAIQQAPAPSAQIGNLNPFQAIQQPQDPGDQPMQEIGFQAPDLVERFAQWSLNGAPANPENQNIVDAPNHVGTQLYPFSERPLIGGNAILYSSNHPEYVNAEFMREPLRAEEYPGRLPLQNIPTERSPSDNPAEGQCQEPLRKVRNAHGEYVEICNRVTSHVCEDRRHPGVKDGVDQRWYVSEDCNDFSKLVIANGLEVNDIVGMRAYYCNDCGTKADESHFAYSGHRVWGFDPNATVTSELAHQQPEQPGGFRGGFQGAPLPMTGCACAEKLLGRVLCMAHRTTMADDMIYQSKVMQEWRLNMYGKPICPNCRKNVGVDVWFNAHDDNSGNFGNIPLKGGQNRQRVWACMVCHEYVVIKPVNEVAGTSLVPGFQAWLPDPNSGELSQRYEEAQRVMRGEVQEQQNVEMAGT